MTIETYDAYIFGFYATIGFYIATACMTLVFGIPIAFLKVFLGIKDDEKKK